MNLDELRSVQETERSKSNLQELRDSFYEEAGKYVADLKAERQRIVDREENPFSDPEFRRLSDEIDTAEEVVEAIYDRRLGKILEEASLVAAGMGGDVEGLTAEEQVLFENVVGRIESNKERVLDTIAGNLDDGDDPGGEGGTTDPTPDPDPVSDPAPTPDRTSGHDSEDERRSSPDRDRSTGDRGRESTPDARDPSTPESDGGSTGGRRAVEPGSPPPDGGAPDDGVSAAGAMGGGPEGGDADATDAGSTSDAGTATDGSPPDPPAPDELEGPAGGPPANGVDGSAPDGTAVPASAAGGGDAVPDRTGAVDDRVRVKVTDDVGAIYGVDDREYELERESVITLPEANAEPLIDRGAAERLE